MLFYDADQVAFREYARLPPNLLPILEQEHCGYAAYLKLCRDRLIFIDIYFYYRYVVAQFVFDLLQNRGQGLTRTAPGSEKIHQYGLVFVNYFREIAHYRLLFLFWGTAHPLGPHPKLKMACIRKKAANAMKNHSWVRRASYPKSNAKANRK